MNIHHLKTLLRPTTRPGAQASVERSALLVPRTSRRGVVWLAGIEVDSLDLIETYAARGFGIGVGRGSQNWHFTARACLEVGRFCTSCGRCIVEGQTDGLDGIFFGGTPASSTTVASLVAPTARGMSS